MATKAQTTYWLDLGALGEEYEATIKYNWYKPVRRDVDDYPELEVESVIVKIGGQDLDIVDSLTKDTMAFIIEHCWENIDED